MASACEWLKKNKKLLLKSGVLVGSSLMDYYLTDVGISKDVVEEMNPLIESYIRFYGNLGPYFFKAVTSAAGVFAMYCADRNREKSRLSSNHVFYTGTTAHIAASFASIYGILG